MLIQIPNILTQAECGAALDALADEALWRDGKETARGAAREVKNNMQADANAAAVEGIVEKVKSALVATPLFRAFAQPDRFSRVMINKYEAGMSYGAHVDAAYMYGVRADISFTVFLSAPEDYDGGELTIDNAGVKYAVRTPAGAAVVYPSTALHHVAPVQRGARIACFGWAKSRVRSGDQRATLFELERAIGDLSNIEAPREIRDRLNVVRYNLLRQFGE